MCRAPHRRLPPARTSPPPPQRGRRRGASPGVPVPAPRRGSPPADSRCAGGTSARSRSPSTRSAWLSTGGPRTRPGCRLLGLHQLGLDLRRVQQGDHAVEVHPLGEPLVEQEGLDRRARGRCPRSLHEDPIRAALPASASGPRGLGPHPGPSAGSASPGVLLDLTADSLPAPRPRCPPPHGVPRGPRRHRAPRTRSRSPRTSSRGSPRGCAGRGWSSRPEESRDQRHGLGHVPMT